MKIAVYTIALNEAAHAERWANSAADADYRIVADTGSTDDTVERLTRAGVTVHRIAVRPWRFDVARNTAMALIPADVDVCCTMDMDRFLEQGWRPKLEAAWTAETTALFCRTVYRAHVDDPTVLRGWPAKNFHHRWGYRFKRPVHEALVFSGQKEVTSGCDDIVMCEVQDQAKTTRSQYLPLMELAHQEDPDDAQICFWLGRDLMWAKQHERGSDLLQRYLSLPTSTWTEERSEAMRYLARMQPDKKMLWLDKARMEAPHRREIWLDLAEEFHNQSDWLNLFWASTNGIGNTRRTGSYLDDAHCWGFRLFDLGAIAAWHLNVMDRAVEWGQKALDLDPGNERLEEQARLFHQAARRGWSMNDLSQTQRTHLHTTFGTVLYVDAASGEVRHGALGDTRANAVLVTDPSVVEARPTAWLMYNAVGDLEPLLFSADGCWSASSIKATDTTLTQHPLQVVRLDHDLIALQSRGLYLCAEPNGRVTLSRTRCSLWECFIASKDWCVAPKVDSLQGRDLNDPAIDWLTIRSFRAGAGTG